MDEKHSWVNTHKGIVQYLSDKENSQQELIDLLKLIGISPFNDKSKEGDYDIELREIDPFTFFCYIHKYGDIRRLDYLQHIAKKLDIVAARSVEGIPTAQAQRVWLFPFKYLRVNNEIGRLWSFFKKELKGEINNEDFADVLKIKNVGKTKLTEALFYINPEKYLPINRPTKPYIKEVLGLDYNFSTYSEYMELLGEIRDKIDIPFYELSHEAWVWSKEKEEENYWVFQGNPDIYDFETAFREDDISAWTVTSHKNKIKPGDKVIIWITGSEAGCYALAEVASEPLDRASFPESHYWKEDDKSELKAAIDITHNLANNPILKDEIDGMKKLANLNVGHQGTNFAATEEEYEALLELAMDRREGKRYWLYSPGEQARNWEEFYNDKIMGLGWDELDDLKNYKSKEEINKVLYEAYGGTEDKMNDSTANYEFANVMKVGDVVIAKKGLTELVGYGFVASDYVFDKSREEYKHIRKVNWELKGSWYLEDKMVPKTLTDITPYDTKDPNYNTYYERLLGIMKSENKPGNGVNNNQMNFPLNTIFYGPPGTGKTYNTVLRAAEIIEDRKIKDYKEALEIFNENLHNQIEFITFHQNYSYEDFIQGIRPDTDNNEELTFEKRDGVFKKIADRALKNLREWENPRVQKKTFEEAFNEFILPMVEGVVEEIEVKMARVSYFITAVTDKSIDFRKASGGTAHTLSISTLGRMYEAESVLDIKGLTPYYAPLLDELLKIGKDSSDRKEFVQKKNYVIIIDEINRANISRVFGELITLIEPDKRSHGVIPLEAQLPSGDKFLVPSNLYIVGTMNTADKSIALLDIALRRRFEFEAMYPLYEIEGHEVNDADILKKLNERIVSTKGYDFQIGHSFFMDSKEDAYCLVKRMNNKVIPLLLEYYMNDEKEVRSILQFALLKIDETSWPLRITGRV